MIYTIITEDLTTMYSLEQMWKGVKNPKLALDVAMDTIMDIIRYRATYRIHNELKRQKQVGKQSSYGVVFNWGHNLNDRWIVTTYPFLAERLIERFDPIIITNQRCYEDHVDELDHIFAYEPNCRKAATLEYQSDKHETICVMASDPDNKTDWFGEYTRRNNVDHILTPYYSPFRYYFPDIDESRIVHFPWAVPEDVIIDPSEIQFHGDDNIHIFGAFGREIYELRQWCRQHDFVRECGDSASRDQSLGHHTYYQWLQNFDSIIAAGSLKDKWKFVFAKYYEIPASGALLFAQYCDDLERAGFTERNCVIFDSKENFRDKADEYLNDPESFMDRRKRGVKLIRERHTVEDRVDTVEELFS
jgi:hypothetical protein